MGQLCGLAAVATSAAAGPEGTLGCHAGDPHGKGASGAMSAAARELRPTEIVGMYESHKETLEVTDTAAGCCN